jgi:hypothetical protein
MTHRKMRRQDPNQLCAEGSVAKPRRIRRGVRWKIHGRVGG